MGQAEITQMRREIEVLKICQNPNVVKLVDLFETQIHHIVVMELM